MTQTYPEQEAAEGSSQSIPFHTPLWRLQGVFFEPAQTFREIGARPNWVIPMLLLVLLATANYSYIVYSIGYEEIVRQQVMMNPRIQDLPKEQQEALIEQATQSSAGKYFSYVAIVLFSTAGMALLAVLFLLGMMLLASDLKYPQVLSVTLHSFFAYSLISSVLGAIILYLAPDKGELDLQNLIQSNLGLVVDKGESPVLYSVASSIDILSFYLIYLLALGFSTAGRKTRFGSALTVVLLLWVIYVAGKAGIAALFS